jgi:hypothetical protein
MGPYMAGQSLAADYVVLYIQARIGCFAHGASRWVYQAQQCA